MSDDRATDPQLSATDEQAASTVLPSFIAKSFLTKFLVALLVVTVVIGGVSATTYTQTDEQLTDETRNEYIGVAQQSATQIEEWRQSRADRARMLSQFEVIKSGTQQERQQFLEAEAGRVPEDVYRIHLVNLSTANIIASTDPAKEGEILNTREAPWQTDDIQYNQNGVFISEASEAQSRSMVSFVTPVETESAGEIVLVMQMDMDALAGNLPTTGDQMFSQVVDAQGRVVAGTQVQSAMERNDGSLEEYAGGQNGSAIPGVQRALGGQSTFLGAETVMTIKSGLGADHVAAYAPVAGDDWVVATHVPVSAAYELRQTITRSLGVLVATTFVGLGLVGLVFGRGSVRALNRLTRKADELESGNLDVDLSVTRADEFGRLTASFGNMRDALRNRIEEAEAARKEAEVSRSEAIAVNEYLQEKAGDYSEVMRRCANGDLTQRMDIDNENEAMDRIATEFNAMLEELEKTTGQLKTFSDDVAESSDVVLTSAEAVRSSAEDVTASVDSITDESATQHEQLADLSTALDDVVDSLAELDDRPEVDVGEELATFERVAEGLAEASETSEAIQSEADTVSAVTREQADELDEVSAQANRLKRYARPLGDILDRFETGAEHEFVFSGGPSQPVDAEDD